MVTLQKWHVVVADQQLSAKLQQFKRTYGEDLAWLLPYPGDWHLLKNFQPVLMKLCGRAGLLNLAEASGYKGSNLTSLEACTHFKRTHVYLLEALKRV